MPDALDRVASDPAADAIYRGLLQMLEEIGSFTIEPGKESYQVRNGRAFLGVHPRRGALRVSIVPQRALTGKRVDKVEQVSRGRFHNGTNLVAVLAVGALLFFGGVSCGRSAAASTGHVTGIVAAAPAGPIDNRTIPTPNQKIDFISKSSGATSTTTSGSDGGYAISLAPGTYEVRLVGFAPLQLYYGRDPNHYDLWPIITVTSGQDMELDLTYDSRIR